MSFRSLMSLKSFMSPLTPFIATSVGRKAVMSVTGLGAIGFLCVHLLGNTFIFGGPDSFNAYAHALHSIPVLPLLQIALGGMFFVHVLFGATVTWCNWTARSTGYQVGRWRGVRSLLASSMIFTGIFILAFIAFHLWTVRYAPSYAGHDLAGQEIFRRVQVALTSRIGVSVYLIGVLALAFHLTYGLANAFQSLGLRHPSHDGWIALGGFLLAWGLALSFATIPILFLLGRL